MESSSYMKFPNRDKPIDIQCVPRAVNYYTGECSISGKKISDMEHSLELCKSYYENSVESVCLTMSGIEELEKCVKNESFGKDFNDVKIIEKEHSGCFRCSGGSPFLKLENKKGLILMKICKNCLEDKLELGKEIMEMVEGRVLHYDNSGFVIQETKGIKDILGVNGNKRFVQSDICITFGTYPRSNKRHFRIEDLSEMINILSSKETDRETQCGICDKRKNCIILPVSSNMIAPKIKICNDCKKPIKNGLKDFLDSNSKLLASKTI